MKKKGKYSKIILKENLNRWNKIMKQNDNKNKKHIKIKNKKDKFF